MSSKLKIGIFTETYQPTVNGVVVSIDTFKHVLEQEGHEYVIFAPENKEAKPEPNIYRFPSIQPPKNLVYPLAQPLPYALAKYHFPLEVIAQLDIIHIQHFSRMGQYGLQLAKEFTIPAVYTYHTMAELYAKDRPIVGPLSIPYLTLLTRSTAAKADHIVTPTPSVKEYLQRIGVTQEITPIPTGIVTRQYKHVSQDYVREKYKIPVHQDILLFVGRLAVEKNVFFLLDAFRKVVKARPHTHLILVGDGADREKCEQIVQQHRLGKNVTMTGFVDRAETIKLFGSADLFVFPSITDTQGIVIIEAMAGGSVPVAIDILGPHDIIEHGVTGLLTPLNLEAFSGSIIDLLADKKLRHSMSVAARHAALRYDAVVTGHQMLKLYQSVIAKHKK